jgi:nicotinamidase-related amidase
MIRFRCIGVLCLGFATAASGAQAADETPEWQQHRPKVPGTLRLHLRERRVEGGQVRIIERSALWAVAETAIIVCDMWDDGFCRAPVQRVGVMVPRMNEVLWAARDHGVMVIHAPSTVMNVYADKPQRLRMQRTEPVTPPVPISSWCPLDADREPPPVGREGLFPFETKIGGCDDPVPAPMVRSYSRQHSGLDIAGFDGISDQGGEIFSYCRRQGIKNIAIMGISTNVCVLSRSFGIRQLVRLGFQVALVRDLTDVMYDPRQPPYVSHARGTELVVEHIEAYWCPSIESGDLTNTVPGSAGPVSGHVPEKRDTSRPSTPAQVDSRVKSQPNG